MLERIVVATDFSEVSRKALIMATTLFQGEVRKLWVLHVIDKKVFDTLAEHGIQNWKGLHETVVKKTQEKFDRFLSSTNIPEKIEVHSEVVTSIPFVCITDTASRVRADLIVIGTMGKTGFNEMVKGSLTQKVIKTAACPVFVYK